MGATVSVSPRNTAAGWLADLGTFADPENASRNSVFDRLVASAPKPLASDYREALDELLKVRLCHLVGIADPKECRASVGDLVTMAAEAHTENQRQRMTRMEETLRLVMVGLYVGFDECGDWLSRLVQAPLAASAARQLGPMARKDPAVTVDVVDRTLVRVWRSRPSVGKIKRWDPNHRSQDLSADLPAGGPRDTSSVDFRGAPVGAWLSLLLRSEVNGARRTGRSRCGERYLGEMLRDRAQFGVYTPETPEVKETRVMLASCMDQLKAQAPKLADVVTGVYWNNLSLRQVAAIVGCSHSTVAGMLKRALVSLRKCLDKSVHH